MPLPALVSCLEWRRRVLYKAPTTWLPERSVSFGVGDGGTLSVVNNMPRKSPVIMMKTISNGVRIA
jgi:hypothetical protein